MGCISAAVYRGDLANTLPAGVPSEAVQIIRVGSGCLACLGERLPSEAEG